MSRTFDIESAASDNDLAKVKNIVEQGVNQAILNAGLSCAVAYSNTVIADYLLEKGADLEWGDNDPVYWACHNGEEEGVKYALSKGVDVNCRNGIILTMCITSMEPGFVQWLIDQGAQVNINEGQALIFAIIYNKTKSVEVLLRNGANPRLRNRQAFLEAKQRGFVEIEELLNRESNSL